MRQRLYELRGILEIESADPGTRLRATIPLTAPLTAEFVSSVFAPAWHTGLTPAPPASPAGEYVQRVEPASIHMTTNPKLALRMGRLTTGMLRANN
jgi:hypothetical protein